MHQQGMIDAKQLEELADAGEIDTVLCMFTDFQGRFVGKRILPHFFLEDVMGEEGLHACLYLIAIDMEMEPLPGFEYASWETGYGDFKMIPDMSTLRLVPWLEKTAMVICDVADEHTGELVEVAPRHDPEAARSSGRRRPATRSRPARSSSSTCSRSPTTRRRRSGYQDLAAVVPVHHGLPHAPDHQGRVADPPDPQRDVRARGSRSSSRRASSARASTRSTSRTPTRWRRPTTTRSTSTA